MPQGYLRAFASDDKRTRVWRFSKTEGDAEEKRIAKVAYRHHLYTPRGENGERDIGFEKKAQRD